MRGPVEMVVNGKAIRGEVDSRKMLVEFLREDLRLTGTHVGCDTSQCGACTVLVDGISVKSCTVFTLQVQGSEVTTIEGVAQDGTLHPVQHAFREHHALQCGFCTPGMVLSVIDLLRRIPSPSEEEIRWNLEGNLCRCTGYQNIVDASLSAAKAMATRAD